MQDKYGLKSPGSTTDAIIEMTHTVSMMYMQCLLIDFSKAIDSADHAIFINKLKALNINDNIVSG